MFDEWDIRIAKDYDGRVFVTICEVTDGGQYRYIDSEAFGAVVTAQEVCQWLTRHWAPRARLQLR